LTVAKPRVAIEKESELVNMRILYNKYDMTFMQLTVAKSSKKKTDTSGNKRSSVEERRKEHHNSEARLGRRILKVSAQHHKTNKKKNISTR
jgi:starvation-inducible outer membrane lipoprotein